MSHAGAKRSRDGVGAVRVRRDAERRARAAAEEGGDGASTRGSSPRGGWSAGRADGETYERDIIEARASDEVADVVEAVAVACDALIERTRGGRDGGDAKTIGGVRQGGGVDHGRYRGEDDAETERR